MVILICVFPLTICGDLEANNDKVAAKACNISYNYDQIFKINKSQDWRGEWKP
ncbi:uncharacterized protein G2W53_019949 [Senna tora]|uniref:Uncharacterized protein n=1 Tax=Senna tora TaxID=362788 RepID=A0A834WMF9_9FABA|nr:uncharacterized protein G2W53_019949 [Senna tora]